ncbi:hypothetical protein F443_08433 [Phytophthora nicotianae P1569]|uniref:HTH psq-type domain-containing protein n=2 Tax=Phytophthora nicotianae TaxID=4792 RepID=V9F9E0_PHYNI|nr:hypothetical protein F443_08433 [Phytophthora nicotianae P1569]
MEAESVTPLDEPQVPLAYPETDESPRIARRKHYSFRMKRAVLQGDEGIRVRAAAKQFGIPRRSLNDWIADKENILAYKGSEKTLALTTGRPESIPFSPALVVFMKDLRRTDQELTTTRLAQFIRKKLLRLANGLFNERERHGSSIRLFIASSASLGLPPWENRENVIETQQAFSEVFNTKYGDMPSKVIVTIDETGVFYDTPPARILCERGALQILPRPKSTLLI